MIKQSGTTMSLVEQNVAAALSVADSVYILDQGKRVCSGSAYGVYHNSQLKGAYSGI